MSFLNDPDRVHEILAVLMLIVLFPAGLVAMCYVNVLGAFFRELEEKEPEVWKKIGAPGLLNMLVLPLRRFRKYYAFLPVLKERAARDDGSYTHARRAYMLYRLGLAMCAVLFTLAASTAFWIGYHGL